MSIKKTLGGERLGSGNKMKVKLHDYEHSNHDLSYLWRSTMAAGTLVPFMSELALPDDTFIINLDAKVLTHPTIGPLFGSYKIQLDVFECPIRLYNSFLHNNRTKIGMNMEKIKFPLMKLGAHSTNDVEPSKIDNIQINPSCILKYLGLSGIGTNGNNVMDYREFNATSYIAYWDIYKNYYAPKFEEIGGVLHTGTYEEAEILKVYIMYQDAYQEGETGSTLHLAEIKQSPATSNYSGGNWTQLRIETGGGASEEPNLKQIVLIGSAWSALGSNGMISVKELIADEIAAGGYWDGTLGLWCYSIDPSYLIEPNINLGPGLGMGYTLPYSWRGANPTDISNKAEPRVVTFPLENIDEMRDYILHENTTFDPVIINDFNKLPYSYICDNNTGYNYRGYVQEGLAVKSYQSDINNNWLNTEWVGYINDLTAISTAGNKFTIDQLNLANKQYNIYNRIAVSGGSYNDWLEAVWASDRLELSEIPIYRGGLIRELAFQEVVSNSSFESNTGEQPLGTLAGRGVMTNKEKGGKIVIKTKEPSYIIGIISLTPRIDYSQGNRFDLNLKSIDDLHKPGYDEIGFEDASAERLAWWTTDIDSGEVVQKSFGKQPAWINYMTNYNRTYGNFAEGYNNQVGEMFMTLNRRYEAEKEGSIWKIKDLTTLIDPSKYNFIFAEVAIASQNFWTQISVDIKSRRKMSAKIMPNL